MPLHEDRQVRTVKCCLPGDIVGKKSDVLGAARPQCCDQEEETKGGGDSGCDKHSDGTEGCRANRVKRGYGALWPGPLEEAVRRQPRAEASHNEEQQCQQGGRCAPGRAINDCRYGCSHLRGFLTRLLGLSQDMSMVILPTFIPHSFSTRPLTCARRSSRVEDKGVGKTRPRSRWRIARCP